ncbi:MAG: hypothetical protein Q9213_006023 [Squamulea squamosa]
MSNKNYIVPTAVVARIGGNGQGNATLVAPAGGFAESGLARIFGSDFVAPSTGSQPQPPSRARDSLPNGTKRAIIAGAIVGGSVLLGLTVVAGWFFRRTLQQILIGDLMAPLEMDGKGKTMAELPTKGTFWELPGSPPAELWTPTTTDISTSSREADEFKHETRSDRELGWRGETECVGDLAKGKVEVDEERRDDNIGKSISLSCKEIID